MLRIQVRNKHQQRSLTHAEGPLEFGRVSQGRVSRVVLDDPFVSRDQLRVVPASGGRLRVENLSSRTPVQIEGREELIVAGTMREFALPLVLLVGTTRIDISEERAPSEAPESPESWQTILRPARWAAPPVPALNLATSAEPLTPERLAQWFETVISVQRAAAGSAEFYEETAKAVVDLIGLDGALVLLRRGTEWEAAASHARSGTTPPVFSRTILARMVEQGRTFYRTLEGNSSGSLMGIEAVVVSPILDPQGEVVGAVYGQRYHGFGAQGPAIQPLEAQLVQLLAAAVGAGLARQQREAEAARSRVQFEQFFSSALARELQADPAMLDGRDCEITVLFSDIRGFSGLSEVLSPAEACRLVGDVMERLTARIVEHEGVVVDYLGDGLLAMWNAPSPQPEHALLACRAARAMLAEVPALNDAWRGTLGAPLALGIGLNTGLSRVGNIGSRRRFKYGPLGHTVNLASRLEGLTKYLGVSAVVSGATRQLLGTSIPTRRLCRARVVGIAAPLDVYELADSQCDAQWEARRDGYEVALEHFEAGRWAEACQVLYPLLAAAPQRYDLPSLALLGRAVECLKTPPTHFDAAVDFSRK